MNRKQLTYVLGAVLVVALGVVVYLGYFADRGGANLLTGGGTAKVDIKPTDNVHGSPNAPIVMVEYASMTCPHCAAFQRDIIPQLTKEYIDTGKVKLVFREFPLDGAATMAAALARCQKGDNYFAFIDLLFKNQDKWWFSLFQNQQNEVTREKVVDNLVEMGRFAGMSRDQVVHCIDDKANLDIVQANWQEGQTRYSVNSTPTILINGEVHRGEISFDALKKVLDPLLAKS